MTDTWKPGDPCGTCGSRETVLYDGTIPHCRGCGAFDDDE